MNNGVTANVVKRLIRVSYICNMNIITRSYALAVNIFWNFKNAVLAISFGTSVDGVVSNDAIKSGCQISVLFFQLFDFISAVRLVVINLLLHVEKVAQLYVERGKTFSNLPDFAHGFNHTCRLLLIHGYVPFYLVLLICASCFT